jgi:MFS family permease
MTDILRARGSVLLTVGYVAHCWEVLGLWAWAPTFLAASLAAPTPTGAAVAGVWIAVALHLACFAATLFMGDASDRWGRRVVLLATAAAGALFSFSFGWCGILPAPALLAVAFAYSFSALGDSGVLSTAMTEAVPPSHLGRLLALRSVLGFGAGAVSPVVFGWVLDLAKAADRAPEAWGWSFAVLGLGGAVATVAAALLPASASRSSRGGFQRIDG